MRHGMVRGYASSAVVLNPRNLSYLRLFLFNNHPYIISDWRSPSFLQPDMGSVPVAGLASAALQVIGSIESAIQGLHSLKGKFQGADNTIRLLISQLSMIKAALFQIRDWAEFNSDDSPNGTEFIRGLKDTLDECQAVMGLLSEELKGLTSPPTLLDSLPSQRNGAKILWGDAAMKGHLSTLSRQKQALQVLITASQWYNLSPKFPPLLADNRPAQMQLHSHISLV